MRGPPYGSHSVGGRGETPQTGRLAPASGLSDQAKRGHYDDRQAGCIVIRRCPRLREFLTWQVPPGLPDLVGLPVQERHSRTSVHTGHGTSRTCRTRRKEPAYELNPHIAPRARDATIAVSYDTLNGWTVLDIDREVAVRSHCRPRETVTALLGKGRRHFVLGPCFVPFLDSTCPGADATLLPQRAGSARHVSP